MSETAPIPPVLKTEPGGRPFARYWPFAFLVGMIGLALLAPVVIRLNLTWRCPWLDLTGMPCCFCGGTRAMAALGSFHFMDAIKLNPLVTLSVLAASLGALIKLFFKGIRISGPSLQGGDFEARPWTHMQGRDGRSVPPKVLLLVVAGVALFVLNWLYLILYLPR